MIKIDTLIIGLNKKVLSLTSQFESCLVIDDKSAHDSSEVIDFNDDRLLGLYQSSTEAARFEVDDFDAMAQFYQMVVELYQNNYRDQSKEIVNQLKERNIEVKKGRVQFIDEHHCKIEYLEQETLIEFNQVILNVKDREPLNLDNPYLYTLDELIASQMLPKQLLIEARALKDLAIAKIFRNFGVEVKVLLVENVWREIDHLMFRDALKETLIESGIEMVEKVEILSIEGQATFGIVNYSSIKDGFPVQKEMLADNFTFFLRRQDAIVKDAPQYAKSISDFLKPEEVIDSQAIFVTPPYVSLVRKERSQDGLVLRLNADEISYFKRIHEEFGGLEVIINKTTKQLESAIFYCHDALVLSDVARLIMEQKIPLDSFDMQHSNGLSILSVFEEIAYAMKGSL